jgi:hypothetical protein
MKLNDLIGKIDENADAYANKDLLNGGVINHLYHLTINSEKFEFSKYNRAFDEELEGVYYRVKDDKDKPYTTTLSQYKNYIVDDYTVEYDSRKNYDDLNLHIYLDIRLKERTYPTLEEFMNTYLKDVPDTQKDGDEEYFTSIIVYKGEIYRRSPDMLFKFRHYKVHKCYHGKIDLFAYHRYTPKESPYDPVYIPRYTPPMYVIFLRK